MRSFENIEFGKQHPVAGQHANDLQGVKKSGILSASTLDISEGLVSTNFYEQHETGDSQVAKYSTMRHCLL